MQRDVWQTLTRLARAEHGQPGKLEPTDDFGFHYPWPTVLECWQALRDYHVLPGPGGWLDQDEFLRRDIMQLDRLYAEAWLEMKPRGGGIDWSEFEDKDGP